MTRAAATPRRRLPRTRLVAFALVLVGVGGLSTASAATLKVAATGRDDVAAGSANLTSCDTSVTAKISGYTWHAESSSFRASSVDVSDIAAACADHPVSVAVVDASGTVLATGSSRVGAAAGIVTVALTAPLTTPTAAGAVHVVIS